MVETTESVLEAVARSTEDLAERLVDRDYRVQSEALDQARALANCCGNGASSTDLAERDAVVARLGRLIRDASPRVRQSAGEAVRIIGAPAASDAIIDALIDLCSEPQPGLRLTAIEAIGAMGAPVATSRVVEKFEDLLWDEKVVFEAVVRVIGILGPDVASPSMREKLQDLIWASDDASFLATTEVSSGFWPGCGIADILERLAGIIVLNSEEREVAVKAAAALSPTDASTLRSRLVEFVNGRRGNLGWDLRNAALNAFISGDYTAAEFLLLTLAESRFELPSTYMHLARIYAVRDDLEGAAARTQSAWDLRNEAPEYIVPRILWFQIALSILNAPDCSVKPLLGKFKFALKTAGCSAWTMQPILNHLQPRLSPNNHKLLTHLAAVVDDRGELLALRKFPEWRAAKEAPL